MSFRDKNSINPGNVTEFNLSAGAAIQVWDVTDPTTAKSQQFDSPGKFRLPTDSLLEFIAFDGSSFLSPMFTGAVANQNLHGLGEKDMIILTHPNFLSEAYL